MRLFEFLECFVLETEVSIRENAAILYHGKIADVPHRVCCCRVIVPRGAIAEKKFLVIETKRM